MIEAWSGLSRQAFHDEHLHRQPLARPASIEGAAELLDHAVLDDVLAAADADILVVAGGKLLPLPAPRDRDELAAYLRTGIGICARHAHRAHPVLAAVAAAFERDLGPTQVQVYVTASRTHGFGWHFDDEDVFVAQTGGTKDYYFRANTVAYELRSNPSAFARYPAETSEMYTAHLAAGDFLYIPGGWWHMAMCDEESRSISVGVMVGAPS